MNKQSPDPLTQFGGWCGQQDSNLHALAVEPKSTESTNSTMPACSLSYHGEDGLSIV